eukprot:5276742-Amphidinium_carterae.1
MVLPKLEAPGQAGSAQPSAAIRGFEVWALKIGLTVASWTRSPEVAHGWWQDCLSQATLLWQSWSTQTPAQRVQEQLSREVAYY